MILRPEALAKDTNKYAVLQLLIPETRHSGQFQHAIQPDDVLARGFRAAFKVQMQLQGKLSCCDFLTLHNEHEAFQCGNDVVGALTGWQADDPTLGVLSTRTTPAAA